MTDLTADAFVARLRGEASELERRKYRRYFPERHDEFMGVRMGAVFAAARDFAGMDLNQIERLLENDAHEVRAGAVRIMAEQAKARATTDETTPEPAEAEELVSLEEADAEEKSGKVKAVVPESEDDIEVDETLDDDDDDDSTFIADEEEGDEDVTDIIGDVGGDEET